MPPRAPQTTPAPSAPTNEPSGEKRLMRWALATILILATSLRLYNLDRLSFWFDEFLTVTLASEPLARLPAAVRQSEQTPPLLHVLMHGWMKLFGVSEFAVRLPAAVFGILAVWVTYLLGVALFGRREGFVAALLMALSGFQIAYSQEARVYSLLLLMGLTSSLFFVKLLREGGLIHQVAYVLATGILYWTHLHAVFVVAAQQLTWLYLALIPYKDTDTDRPRISTPRWILLSALSAALFAPWIPTVVHWLRSVSQAFWIPPMGPGFLPHVYVLFAGSAVLLVILLLLATWGAFRTPDRWKIIFLISLTLLPVLVPYIASLILRPLFVHRYAITAATGLFLLAGRGLTALPDRRAEAAVLTILIALSALSIPAVRSEVDSKPDVRAASWYVADHAHEGDFILLDGGAASTTLLQYLHTQDMGRFTVVVDAAQLPAATTLPPQTTLWSISVIPRDASDTPPTQPPQLGWQNTTSHPFDHVTVREWTCSPQNRSRPLKLGKPRPDRPARRPMAELNITRIIGPWQGSRIGQKRPRSAGRDRESAAFRNPRLYDARVPRQPLQPLVDHPARPNRVERRQRLVAMEIPPARRLQVPRVEHPRHDRLRRSIVHAPVVQRLDQQFRIHAGVRHDRQAARRQRPDR